MWGIFETQPLSIFVTLNLGNRQVYKQHNK